MRVPIAEHRPRRVLRSLPTPEHASDGRSLQSATPRSYISARLFVYNGLSVGATMSCVRDAADQEN